MDKKTCPACHEPIPDDSIFCPYCGASTRVTRFCRYCGRALNTDGSCSQCSQDGPAPTDEAASAYQYYPPAKTTPPATADNSFVMQILPILLPIATFLFTFLSWIDVSFMGSHSWNLWQLPNFFNEVVEDEGTICVFAFILMGVAFVMAIIGAVSITKNNDPSLLLHSGIIILGTSVIALLTIVITSSAYNNLPVQPGIGLILTLLCSGGQVVLLAVNRSKYQVKDTAFGSTQQTKVLPLFHSVYEIDPNALHHWIKSSEAVLKETVMENWAECIHQSDTLVVNSPSIHGIQCVDKVLCYTEESNYLYLIFMAYLQDGIILLGNGQPRRGYFTVILENLEKSDIGTVIVEHVKFPQSGSENILGPYNSRQEILNEISGIFRNVSR